jgi:hypothetical protein
MKDSYNAMPILGIELHKVSLAIITMQLRELPEDLLIIIVYEWDAVPLFAHVSSVHSLMEIKVVLQAKRALLKPWSMHGLIRNSLFK